jgi:hypothetical protein
MTTIRKDVVTLINVFAVEPQDQQRLVDLLIEATEKTMKGLPGYVSANFHRSLDGRHVANYAPSTARLSPNRCRRPLHSSTRPAATNG